MTHSSMANDDVGTEQSSDSILATEVQHQNKLHKIHTEQPVEYSRPALTPEVQQQLALGSVALGTMLFLTILLREIRLLVEACKS